ncbi:MAG: hypothetical protein WC107_02005 [Patescibacteria group bacterium]
MAIYHIITPVVFCALFVIPDSIWNPGIVEQPIENLRSSAIFCHSRAPSQTEGRRLKHWESRRV